MSLATDITAAIAALDAALIDATSEHVGRAGDDGTIVRRLRDCGEGGAADSIHAVYHRVRNGLVEAQRRVASRGL